MQFRDEVHRYLRDTAYARVCPLEREPALLRLPLLLIALLCLGLLTAGMVRGDELTRGQVVVRIAGTHYIRCSIDAAVAEVYVRPGDPVVPGQLLARLEAPALDRELALAELAEREATIAMLRAPNSAPLRAAVHDRAVERRAAALRHTSAELRAREAGVVSSLRAEVGARVHSGDIVLSVDTLDPTGAGSDARGPAPELVAYFPGTAAAQIEAGAAIRVRLGDRPEDTLWFEVSSVGRELVHPGSPREIAELAALDSGPQPAVAVVRGYLRPTPGEPTPVLYDGMIGEAELVLRERSLLRRGLESLGFVDRRPPPPGPDSGRPDQPLARRGGPAEAQPGPEPKPEPKPEPGGKR